MLNLQRLIVLHELERRGSLAAVARALDYSPSAVSQQIAQLEREVGTALTEPVGRGVLLTDAARILVVHTRVAIDAIETAESELAASSVTVGGRLKVASLQTALLSLLPAALEVLSRDCPDLVVEVSQRGVTEAVSGLRTGAFEVVVGEEYPGAELVVEEGLQRQELGADRMMLALPSSGPWSDTASLQDVTGAPWALDPAPSVPGRWAREICRAAGFEPDVRFDGVDLLVHLQMVRAGRAVSLVPELLRTEWAQGVRLLPLPGEPQRQLFTLTRTARVSHPAVVEFRRALEIGFERQHPRHGGAVDG
jgi:DNA-binding transcriptional LysR family regulator